MTRFARAKGSKASNERVPEQATSWDSMKRELQKSQKEQADQENREKMNNIREENYQKFIKEINKSSKIVWAEFKHSRNNEEFETKKLKLLQKSAKGNFKSKEINKAKKANIRSSEINNETIEFGTDLEDVNKKLKTLQDSAKEYFKSEEANKVNEPKITTSSILDLKLPNSTINKKLKVKYKVKRKPIQAVSTSEESNKVDERISKNNSGKDEKLKKKNKKRLRKTTDKTLVTDNNTDEITKKHENGGYNEEQIVKHAKIRKTDKVYSNKEYKRRKPDTVKPEKITKPNDKTLVTDNSSDEITKKHENGGYNEEQILKYAKKRKAGKVRSNKEHKRRKPDIIKPEKITILGKEEEIVKFDGFPVTKTDFVRLQKLRKHFIKKGVPKSEIFKVMQSERRKAEKFLARQRKKLCFNCRESGHLLGECPKLQNEIIETTGTDVCFKCGSTEHTSTKCNIKSDTFKFAQCFICKEQGHIARQCPDNPRGLYPEGGACKLCGDVTHFKKDCPQNQEKLEENALIITTINDNNLEGLEEEVKKKNEKFHKRNVIKF